MTYIGIIRGTDSIDYPVGSTLYGTCGTAAETAQKDVTISYNGWTGNNTPFDSLQYGITIHVYMTNSNTADNATLKVGNTAAAPIYRYGTTRPGKTAATSWSAGVVISFTYDGSAWRMNGTVTDLGEAARYAVDDQSSNGALGTGTGLTTERDVYYGLVQVNGRNQTRATTIYAPTSAGTSGYYLKSNGSGAPSWSSITVGASVGSVTPAAIGTSASAGTSSTAARADHVHTITKATVTSVLGNSLVSIGSTDPGAGYSLWITP